MVSNFPAATCSDAVFPEVTLSSAATHDFEKAREVVFLGAGLALCQLLDGILTGVGVRHFGTQIEANVLLRYAMTQLGELTALALFKAAAVLIIISLCYLASRISWIRPALRLLIAIYVVGAILPWGYILINRII